MTTQTIEKPLQEIQDTHATTGATAEYPRVQALLRNAGGGAWVREASLTLALAAQAQIHLDETALIYSDVRDLMALQRSLRAAQSEAGQAKRA